jgi:type I restriction enzyme S subunit
MKLDTFFDNFDLLADAPNGVQKLRELILQLAVMGKLVPQDDNDEPASVLLEKVKLELKVNKNSKYRQATAINEDEIPYLLPHTWKWVRLAGVVHDWGQKKPDVEFTYIDVSSINKEKGIISNNVNILQPNEAPSRARKIVSEGTVIYSTVRPYLLNIAIVDKEFKPKPIVSTAFAVLHPFSTILARYLYFYLRSKPFIEYVEAQMKGMAYPAINDGQLYEGLVPLPPLVEQHRIVAKIDELMALCDRLSSRQQQRRETRIIINNAAIGQLLTACEPEVFNKSWQHICNNFDLLYSTPDNIGKLRQAILQLAVQGKLVPQDDFDEPASVLLEKIKFEKERLVKEGKIKKFEELPPIKADEVIFEVPEEWKWVKLGELGYFFGGGTPSKSNHSFWEGQIPWVSPKDMKKSYIFDVTDHISVEALKQSSVQLIPQNSLLMVVRGMILAHSFPVAISMTELTINQDMKALHFLISEISEYVLLACRALQWVMLKKVARSSHGTCRIDSKDLSEFIIPLPPLAEQHRIITKVNQLMSLCDTLETKLTQSVTDSEKLMEAAVRQILAANSTKTDKYESTLLESISAEAAKPETKTAGRRNKKTQQQCAEAVQLNLPGFE